MESQIPREEDGRGLGEEKSGTQEERMRRKKMRAGLWLTVCVLLLLFSVLFFVFFVFSGVTECMHEYKRRRGGVRHGVGEKAIRPLS
jgi:heme/copper-type cytochrome/quinol oxidase subunit 3